jgi:hypothetical protein
MYRRQNFHGQHRLRIHTQRLPLKEPVASPSMSRTLTPLFHRKLDPWPRFLNPEHLVEVSDRAVLKSRLLYVAIELETRWWSCLVLEAEEGYHFVVGVEVKLVVA